MTSTASSVSSKPAIAERVVLKVEFLQMLEEPLSCLPLDIVKLVADYVGNSGCFGRYEWRRYFGVDVVDQEPDLTEEFYKFWNGPDPLEQNKRVCETHFLPVFFPKVVRNISNPALMDLPDAELSNCLNLLGRIVKKPSEGHSSKFDTQTMALDQNGGKTAVKACWLVVRKAVSLQGAPAVEQIAHIKAINQKTKAGYEEEFPSALELSTILFVHHLITGERYFGNSTGMEKLHTASRCKEDVISESGVYTYKVFVGHYVKKFEGEYSYLHGLTVYHDYVPTTVGIACVRKF